MAKRKRLTPFGTFGEDVPETNAAQAELEQGNLSATRRLAPIADMAGSAAATAALEEVAEDLRLARASGRMVLSLPLDAIDADYLVRDRIVAGNEEMVALQESLRAHGQRSPIEVVALGPERFGLISGWRRLRALRSLLAETGDQATFGSVLALLRKPDQACDAYIAMVEENEIRVGLSFFERARIVMKSVELGVFEDDRAALRGLFHGASRAKRSKIGSFQTVVRELDGSLRFPELLGERLGLQLAHALEANATLAARLRDNLAAFPARDPVTEQGCLLTAIERLNRKKKAVSELVLIDEPAPGLRLSSHASGRIVIDGPGADATFRARLLEWLKGQHG